jgi:arsenite methyltransferase
VAGALLEAELLEIPAALGFTGGQIVERFDSYRGTTAVAKLSPTLGVQGVNFLARKPRARTRGGAS